MSSSLLTALRQLDHRDETTLKTSFNEIMSKAAMNDNTYLQEIVDILIKTNFPCVFVIDHPIFIHLRNTFIDILQKSGDDFDLLCRIGQLFSRMADHVDDKNIHLFQQLFIDATTVQFLSKQLSIISSASNANLISGIEHMISAYQKFQEYRSDIQDNSILSSLIIPIVNFVKSSEYKTSLLRVSPNQDKLTSFQKIILITCPKYIVSFWCKRQEEVASIAAEVTLSRSVEILQQLLPTIDDWKASIIWCIYYLIRLCQYSSDDRLLSNYNGEHTKILDCVIKIVQGKELLQLVIQQPTSSNLQKRAGQLICYATLYIYATTFLFELRQKLKEQNIASSLLKLTKVNYDKTQFHAYRTLAVILTDDDIKNLANPVQITTVFINYLDKLMYTISRRQQLTNLLITLKSLFQHDQIKAEFVRQTEGLSPLIQCAMGSQFDPTNVQLHAFELIMFLTFNDEAKVRIKQNDNFVQYIQTLTSTTSTHDLQKVANSILWQLFPKVAKTEDEFQYDIMISYAHKDRQMCHRVHQSLVADEFRVWIDIEGMHGALIETMAQAIERSHCVLICMSETYYMSPYCQAEAKYAFEKQRLLIPIKVQSDYKAEGWLAFITSGRIYIDFMKLNFPTAYTQLMSEIRHKPVDRNPSTATSSQSNMEKTTAAKDKRTTYSYPADILQWTPTNVHDFLLDKQLDQMVPVCQLMDGQTFIELYEMCRINAPVMLQTLRVETMEHSAQLSTYIYLKFLREMKNLVPEEKNSSIH